MNKTLCALCISFAVLTAAPAMARTTAKGEAAASAGLGACGALGVCTGFKRALRSVSTKSEARDYINSESVTFSDRRDVYRFTTVTRERIERGGKN